MNKHLTFEELFMLKEGELKKDDKHRILKHLEKCNECRQKLVEIEKLELKLSEAPIVEPPKKLKEEILENAYKTVFPSANKKIEKVFAYSTLAALIVIWYIVFIYTGIVRLFFSDIARRTVKNFFIKFYGSLEASINFIKLLFNKPEVYFLAHIAGFAIFFILVFLFRGKKKNEKA